MMSYEEATGEVETLYELTVRVCENHWLFPPEFGIVDVPRVYGSGERE